MSATKITDTPCYVHPKGRHYRDPASGIRRCIECENHALDHVLMDARDYEEVAAEDRVRIRKRLYMRKRHIRQRSYQELS